MKKILFGTTALLAAGAFASAAQASDPIKLSLGGYMEYWVAGASQDGDYANPVNSFDVQGESEVWFMGKTTLDNGMTIGVRVELEAGSNNNTSGGTDDIIDESYFWLEGKYGQLRVGSDDAAAYQLAVTAPDASEFGGIMIGSEGDTEKYLPVTHGTSVSIIEPIFTNLGDENKLTYFSPRFYGFQGAVSYIPSNNGSGDDGSATSETIQKAANFDEAWSFGVNYAGEFSGVGVKAYGGYQVTDMSNASTVTTNPNANTKDPAQDIGGGLSLSYQGFTVGGSVHRRIQSTAATVGTNSLDGFAWNAGIQYAEGPYAVSFGYANSKVEGNIANPGKDEVDVYRIGASYILGPGVKAFGQVAYSDAQDETGTASLGNEGAWGGAVGLRLNF